MNKKNLVFTFLSPSSWALASPILLDSSRSRGKSVSLVSVASLMKFSLLISSASSRTLLRALGSRSACGNVYPGLELCSILLINTYMIYSVDIFYLIQAQFTSLLAISFLEGKLYQIYISWDTKNIYLKYFINFGQSSRLFPLSYNSKCH